MKILRLSTLSLTFAIAVMTLGYVNPASAAPPDVDCEDSQKDDHPSCKDKGGDDDTTSGGKHPSLILTFGDEIDDNIQSDVMVLSYVDKEGAAVSAGGQTQPNAAGIAFHPKHKAKNPRFVNMDIECVPIDGGVVCADLPSRLQVYFFDWPHLGVFNRPEDLFARCPTKNNCGGVHLALRPYEVNCPDPDPADGTCRSVYTMFPGSDNTVEMSFRVGFSSGLLIEIASDIGGASSPNPGRCLSLMEEGARDTFIAACEDSLIKCNVTVAAFDTGSATGAGAIDGENDRWEVTATNATALICDRQTSTVLGTATMSFGFVAIKKD